MTEESVLQSNLLIQTPDSSVCVTEVSVLQSNLLNMDTWQNQVSTSQRCLYYNWTSWYRHQRDRTKCPHHRGVCITIEPPDTDTNETELSVHITEESVLQLDLLIQTPKGQNQVSTSQRCLYYNRTSWYRHQWDRAKCPHHRGVCFTVGPPNTDTKGTEPSVHISEVSALESSLLIQTPMRQSQVSALQRSLFCSQTSSYRHQCDRAKCLHYRGVCMIVKSP